MINNEENLQNNNMEKINNKINKWRKKYCIANKMHRNSKNYIYIIIQSLIIVLFTHLKV